MTWPKFILTRDLRVLRFRKLLPDCDVAEYGRILDMSLVSWRSWADIQNHHDYLYLGKI